MNVSIYQTNIGNSTPVVIKNRVEDQGPWRCICDAPWRWHKTYDSLKYFVDSCPFFCTCQQDLLFRNTQNVDNLFLCVVYLCTREIDFVDNRDEGQIVLDGKINITDCLSLYSL